MKKPIALIAGEPNSISSEIIFKFWKLKKKFYNKPIVIIGNKNLLEIQKKKLGYKISLQEIDVKMKNNFFNTKKIPIINVKYNQKIPFKRISNNSSKYILKCFDVALDLIKKKKVLGLVNCPVSKENLFKKKYQGITEYLAQKIGCEGNEVMLLYNRKLSVCPVTTHIPLSSVSKKLNKSIILKKINTINNFYKKYFNKKPRIAILGFNPHNFSTNKNSEEKQIIFPVIKKAKEKKIKIFGPISADTSFMNYKKFKFDVIVGLYHDQVLTPFKALFNYAAINITLGLPFIRITPDHGVAENITGKKIANPTSLINSIKFFNHI